MTHCVMLVAQRVIRTGKRLEVAPIRPTYSNVIDHDDLGQSDEEFQTNDKTSGSRKRDI